MYTYHAYTHTHTHIHTYTHDVWAMCIHSAGICAYAYVYAGTLYAYIIYNVYREIKHC